MTLPVKIFPPQKLPNGAHADEKLFVVTDIHGSAEAMRRLLSKKPGDARLVFLGDSTDRGKASVGVLKILASHPDAILLRGNHDIMAWYGIHGDPSFSQGHLLELRELWLDYNGGLATVADFVAAEKGCGIAHVCHKDIVEFFKEGKTNELFEDIDARSRRFWRSGDLFFVHGGLPAGKEDKWLERPDVDAVSMTRDVENHWAWYRPYDQEDGWFDRKRRKVAGEPVYIVCGHTGQRFDDLIHDFGMFLDTGYTLKTAATIEEDSVQLVMMPCDEVKECEDGILGIFADAT